MMCVVLFIITNLSVMLIFSLVMIFIHVQFSSLVNLIIISGILGFSGAIFSLLFSKYIALLSVGGKILDKPTNKTEDWLLHILKEQSKQLGIRMPKVAIYHACDMNAFATGACKNSSLVAVSTGLLNNMTYDEIEAVIAHEMSHISNGDMVTMTLIQGVVNTFVIFISRILGNILSSYFSFSSSENHNESNTTSSNLFSENNSLVYCVIFIILELVFGLLANMITLWFSRHREFYADAGSAKLVGCKKMIAALEKLKLSHNPEESNVVMSFCIHGSKDSHIFHELFMSHPSLDNRIEALRCGYYLDKSSFFHN